MTNDKEIAIIRCNADFRVDVCKLRVGHGCKNTPVEKCLGCKHLVIKYSSRGEKLKNRFLKQTASYDKITKEFEEQKN